jgi:hypothetical protein
MEIYVASGGGRGDGPMGDCCLRRAGWFRGRLCLVLSIVRLPASLRALVNSGFSCACRGVSAVGQFKCTARGTLPVRDLFFFKTNQPLIK